MTAFLKAVLIGLLLAMPLAACAPESGQTEDPGPQNAPGLNRVVNVSGSYTRVVGTANETGQRTLILTSDGKFILTPGGAGDYSIDGATITMIAPIFGGAQGQIDGGRLVFPPGTETVTRSFSGSWEKQ